MCGMTAPCGHFRREPYPATRGRVRAWTWATPRAGTFARARLIRHNLKKCGAVFRCPEITPVERLGRRRAAALCSNVARCDAVTCGRRPIREVRLKKPAADVSARA